MSTAEFQSRILTVNFFLKSATTFIKNTGAVDLQKKLAHAVRDWVFTNTDYNEIYSCMKYTNAGSYSTAIAIGMRKVKEYLDPKNYVSCAYSIKRADWENIKKEASSCQPSD